MALKPQVGFGRRILALLGARIRPAILLAGRDGVARRNRAQHFFTDNAAAWFSWMANLKAETTSGFISAELDLGFQRIDPAGVWFAVTGLPLPGAATLLLTVGFVFFSMRSLAHANTRSADTQRAILGFAGVAMLLAGYHRSYDALLLVPLWLITIRKTARPAARSSLWLGFLTVLWILPGAGFWRLLPDILA